MIVALGLPSAAGPDREKEIDRRDPNQGGTRMSTDKYAGNSDDPNQL